MFAQSIFGCVCQKPIIDKLHYNNFTLFIVQGEWVLKKNVHFYITLCNAWYKVILLTFRCADIFDIIDMSNLAKILTKLFFIGWVKLLLWLADICHLSLFNHVTIIKSK